MGTLWKTPCRSGAAWCATVVIRCLARLLLGSLACQDLVGADLGGFVGMVFGWGKGVGVFEVMLQYRYTSTDQVSLKWVHEGLLEDQLGMHRVSRQRVELWLILGFKVERVMRPLICWAQWVKDEP